MLSGSVVGGGDVVTVATYAVSGVIPWRALTLIGHSVGAASSVELEAYHSDALQPRTSATIAREMVDTGESGLRANRRWQSPERIDPAYRVRRSST